MHVHKCKVVQKLKAASKNLKAIFFLYALRALQVDTCPLLIFMKLCNMQTSML